MMIDPVSRLKSRFLSALSILLLAGLASSANARDRGMMSDDGELAAAGSIASPGSTTAVFTNPAGLIGNHHSRLSLQGASPNPTKDPTARALALTGNGVFGAGAGVDYFMPDGSASDSGWAVYGLAIDLSPLSTTIGASGRTGIKNQKGSDFNLGILIHPTSFVTLGGTAMKASNGADSYGAGISVMLIEGLEVITDSAFTAKVKNVEFKPGLKISNHFAGIAVAYGTGATQQFAKDFSGGAFLKLGMNSELELQYNHGGDLPKYYAALSFGF